MERRPPLTSVPLRLGPLAAPGFTIRRSGIRWLCEDGHLCRPGEAIAFCNIGLTGTAAAKDIPQPFDSEGRDLQVALSTTVGGRLTQSPDSSRGGFFDRLDAYHRWADDYVVGAIETGAALPAGEVERLGELSLMLTAGRRGSELAEDRSGLLTGWHLRSRAWRPHGDGPLSTLLSVGICELAGVIRGEKSAFLELFEAIRGPAQVVYVPDAQVVPSARILTEQAHRTAADKLAIAEDLARTFAVAPTAPGPSDWLFAGAMLAALQSSPLTDSYEILGPGGLSLAAAPDAAVLSLNAEPRLLFRHRRLGYTVHLHHHRQAHIGPALADWLRASFEPAPRTLDDIRADYRAMIDLIQARGGERGPAAVIVLNIMSTNGYEDVQTYAPFDEPMGALLGSVHAKEANLMLQDLARERDISIVDVDAITAEFGGQRHLPDGVHQTGALQAELRAEILRILRHRRIPGFEASGFS